MWRSKKYFVLFIWVTFNNNFLTLYREPRLSTMQTNLNWSEDFVWFVESSVAHSSETFLGFDFQDEASSQRGISLTKLGQSYCDGFPSLFPRQKWFGRKVKMKTSDLSRRVISSTFIKYQLATPSNCRDRLEMKRTSWITMLFLIPLLQVLWKVISVLKCLG